MVEFFRAAKLDEEAARINRIKRLDRDCADFDAGVALAVTGAFAEVLTTTHLLDVNLVAHLLVNHFGGDAGPGDAGLADLHAGLSRNEEYLVEGDRVTNIGTLAQIDLDRIAGVNFVLTAVGGNDRVHRVLFALQKSIL